MWSSWNYLSATSDDEAEKVSVTYWMNKLQNLKTSQNIFVSLNPPIEPCDSIFKTELSYQHPVFDQSMLTAREKLKKFQGKSNLWYCGAWTGNGFHEDGYVSGKKLAETINMNCNHE